jgi:hypothetical protein
MIPRENAKAKYLGLAVAPGNCTPHRRVNGAQTVPGNGFGTSQLPILRLNFICVYTTRYSDRIRRTRACPIQETNGKAAGSTNQQRGQAWLLVGDDRRGEDAQSTRSLARVTGRWQTQSVRGMYMIEGAG